MPRRPTIKDIAREAGVSVATVDRVLNARSPVRDDTTRKVAEAARRIGYHARGLLDRRLDPALPDVRLGFVLNKEKQEFYRTLRAEIERAVSERTDVRARMAIRFAPSQSPDDFVACLREVAELSDVVAASAVNHASLTREVQALKDRGIATFALLNDFAQGVRQNYLGLNNIKVGRIAAWMLATAARPGKLAVFVGGHRWHGHELRETGFRSLIREDAPGFTVLDTLVNLETRQLTYEATLDLLDRHPDLRGIYIAGGGMEGAIAALREVCAPRQVALVVSELTSESRAALTDGYVTMAMSTPLTQLCRDLVGFMVGAALNGADETSAQHFLDPQISLPESI